MEAVGGAVSGAVEQMSRAERGPSAWTLARVFWRSLFLQAAWNPEGMQNLGFAYALYPALRRLYRAPEALEAAVERHLRFFNCHPYAAALILGGAVRLEEQIARGEASPEKVSTFKQALMGPLAALGDGFFWLSLQPACGTLAVLAGLFLDLWAVLVYLLVYNAIHLLLRGWFFAAGYRRGDEVIRVLSAAKLPKKGERLRLVAAIASGAVAGVVLVRWPASLGSPVSPAAAVAGLLAGVGLFAGAFLLQGRGGSPYAVVYGAIGLAFAAGLLLQAV